jgi:phosphatidylserine decarboxylase
MFAKKMSNLEGALKKLSFERELQDIKNPIDRRFESIFRRIRDSKLFGISEPKIDYNILSDELNDWLEYDKPKEAFYPIFYRSFDDWFLRELTPSTLRLCKQRAELADVCSPVQGKVRKKVFSGEMALKRSMIEVDTLLNLLGGDDLIQISLQKTDYHHVHSPVDGEIAEILSYQENELFPNSEALWIVKILTDFGVVKVVCIGEWTVQTFISEVRVGQEIKKLDKLGHFYFGSQVLLSLPSGLEIFLDRKAQPRLFIGDPLASF